MIHIQFPCLFHGLYLGHINICTISVQRIGAQFRKYMYIPLKSPSPKCDNDGNTVTALDCLLLPPLSSLVFYESRSTGRPRRCVNDWRKAEPRVTLQTFPIRWPPLPSLPSTAMAPILLMMTQMMVLPQDLLNLALLGIISIIFCQESSTENLNSDKDL